MRTIEPPSPETIARYAIATPQPPKPVKPLSMKPTAVANRKLRAKYYAEGKNWRGQPKLK